MRIKLLLLILVSYGLKAQTGSGARLTAMADAGAALSGIWSVNANQAGLAYIKRPTLAFAYQKSFSGQLVGSEAAIFAFPFKNQVLGVDFYRYGFDSYRQQEFGLSFAKKFGPGLSLATSLRYHQLIIDNYGKSNAFSADAGLSYQLNKYLILGAHLSNLSKSSFNRQLIFSDLPLSIQFGAAYQASEQVLLALTMVQTLNAEADLKMGLEYRLLNLFALRGGISINPFREYAGFGLLKKDFEMGIGIATHQALGYSTQISLSYAF